MREYSNREYTDTEGESLALFQNMSNLEYVKIIFGSEDIPALFARYRKPFEKLRMTRKKTLELVDTETKMILEDSLQDSPHSENMMDTAYVSRNITSGKIKDHSDSLLPP